MSEERVPLREELDVKDTWDLSDIYPSDEKWEEEFAEFAKVSDK